MNFYDYWMKLSDKEKEEIFYQKAIPINNLEELKGMIDGSKENSLIAISYTKQQLSNKLYENKIIYGNIFSDLTYLKNSPPPYYPDLTIEYTITHFKLSPLDYSLMHSSYDTYPYRNKQWPIGKYYGKHYTPPLKEDVIFDFLQSQGGISFELQSSYWKIVSLFPDSKTPFLNWSDSEPWEVKE
jgi:hypothetical protein